MTVDTIDEVFARTLLGDYDDDAPWSAIRELQDIGSREVFDRAAEWCSSAEPLKRARGADILAQLGRTADHPTNNYPDDSFAAVSLLIEREKELVPLSSAIFALGHIGNPGAVPIVSRFKKHPVAEIRFAVACALGSFSGDPTAVDALVSLTRDEDEDVRDWATFGIGALGKSDSPSIRDALVARLDDSFEDARQEAIVGLARLRDERVLPALIAHLKRDEVADIVIEAGLEMLGLSGTAEEWKPADCVSELRKKFKT
jgi:HEAT repeat protein